ncbi:hypothetical protein CPC08DRAFT_710106 [Agrocybe pediades]|nr:hypothetical protein CPC08DRAFT_710106 [Agrocybe pediades]
MPLHILGVLSLDCQLFISSGFQIMLPHFLQLSHTAAQRLEQPQDLKTLKCDMCSRWMPFPSVKLESWPTERYISR